MLDSTI